MVKPIIPSSRPGDAVAVAMPMTTESVIIYLGIVLAGFVVVSMSVAGVTLNQGLVTLSYQGQNKQQQI